jgi:hypothetical protein
MHPLLLLLVVACAALSMAGCQRGTDAAAEAGAGQGAEVDRDGNHARGEGEEGVKAIASGGRVLLPADFPDDLFLPTTYGVSSVMDIGGARLVNLESNGSVASMFDAARAEMERKGWSQTLSMQQADSAMLGFRRGRREATYSFTRRNGDQLMIGIQLRDNGEHP